MKIQRHLQIVLTAAVLSMLLLLGCKREDSITPVPCNVDPWAPESCTFSWGKYNSLVELGDYFGGHDSTIFTHAGDTLKFYGWVYYHGPGEPIFEPFEMNPLREGWNPDAKQIYLTGSEDHHRNGGVDGFVFLQWTDRFLEENPWFVEEFDSLLQKKWYITAALWYQFNGFSPCYEYFPLFTMVALDTVPNN